MHKYVIARIGGENVRVGGKKREGELVEAAGREGELGVEEEGGRGEAASGGRELGGECQLEVELGLTGSTLGDDFGDGVAGDATNEVSTTRAQRESNRAHIALLRSLAVAYSAPLLVCQLEAELGLTGAILGDDFGDGVTGDAVGEVSTTRAQHESNRAHIPLLRSLAVTYSASPLVCQLEAELGLTEATLGNDFGDGVAGDAADEVSTTRAQHESNRAHIPLLRSLAIVYSASPLVCPLEAELSLIGATFDDDFGDGVAGDAAGRAGANVGQEHAGL